MRPTDHRDVIVSTTLDPLIHEAARLKVVTVLHDAESADFNLLLAIAGLTRGNLSAHMAKLINGGYVDEHKDFLDRKPHTNYTLTATGRKAYRQYLKSWRDLTRL